jgi:hypothetical protein
MKRLILLIAFLFAGTVLFAQEKTTSQYLMIVRFKTNFKPSSNKEIQNNIKKWQEYMGNLAQSGDLVAGYRPTNEGATISGKEKSTKPIPYVANDDLVSSVLIIKAENLEAAKAIANKCPVFDLGGSVEVRAMMNVAGR